MSSREKRMRKAKEKVSEPEEGGVVDPKLPPRLFATDRYPSKRLNCNATLEYLLLIRDVLEGSDEFQILLDSCFGSLFRLPVRRCAFSGKLVHGLISRQVVTKKRFELWSAFGAQPLRFSLVEFGHVTGLPCGEFDPGYVVEEKTKARKSDFAYWDKLFGGRRDLNIKDVAAMVAEGKDMPPSRKLKLCLIILVDGVLLATKVEPKPSLKHVKRLQCLNFLGFQWGRESFWWTIKSMLIPDRVMGVCDDPEGVFCGKLRQETLAVAGFPLALQLWAFEAVPGLIERLKGNDDQIILDYDGEKLPHHTGLTLNDILDAENEAELKVQPMADLGDDVDEGWGEFDCEIQDRRVVYLVRLLEGGHKFKKTEWGGGDSAEPLYIHEIVVKDVKEVRKRKSRGAKEKGDEGPALKQRRLSRYFSRQASDQSNQSLKLEEVDAKVDKLTKLVMSLKKMVVEQRTNRRGRRAISQGKFSSSRKLMSVRKQKKKEVVPEKKRLFDESDSEGPVKSNEAAEVFEEDGNLPGFERSKRRSAERGESNVVPLEVARKGVPEEDGYEVYYGSGSNTFFVAEEEPLAETFVAEDEAVKNPNPLSYVDGLVGAKGPCGTEVDFGALEQLVGAITGMERGSLQTMEEVAGEKESKGKEEGGKEDVGGTKVSEELEGETLKTGEGVESAVTAEKEVAVNLVKPLEAVDGDGRGVVVESAVTADKEDGKGSEFGGEDLQTGGELERAVTEGTEVVEEVDVGDSEGENEKVVVELSDSSPMKRTEKHRPEEREAELAALLLAKDPFDISQLVPAVEDSDYSFFESVLVASPKVVHLNAWKFDLENQFFLELATGEEWVSTKHMEALVEFLGIRHADRLKESRCVFLPPWFTSHLVGKKRAFNAAKLNPGRVLGDGRLSGYLTKEGKKWGVDVDTLYTPMIWSGNHWVGLCISLVDWRVVVLDPNPRLRGMEAVEEEMVCLCKMLPFLVAKVCPVPADGPYSLEPFHLERMEGAYENRRSGDCGPVSMKFMELHAMGDPEPRMAGLTDTLVDIIRKQYAMDMYKDWVLPLYMGKKS